MSSNTLNYFHSTFDHSHRAPDVIIQRKAILFNKVLTGVTDFYLEIEAYLFKADIGFNYKIFLALENTN